VLIAIGPRLGEMTTSGYSIIASPVPQQRLVHIHASPEELGSVYQGELMIASGMPQAAAMLAAMEPVEADAWRDSVEQARAEYNAWQQQPSIFKDNDAPLNLWQVVQELKAQCPADTIITNGAGNYATWAHRYWPYGGMRTQLAPTSGAMGYSVPSGVAAKIIDPARTVVTFAGDGEYLMNGQELATAVQYKAGVVIIVFNNQMFGTIRMHQEREYPGRVSGTTLHNPDFAALARAFGGHGETVEASAEFAPALERAGHYRTALRRQPDHAGRHPRHPAPAGSRRRQVSAAAAAPGLAAERLSAYAPGTPCRPWLRDRSRVLSTAPSAATGRRNSRHQGSGCRRPARICR
jgi:acetolactate synthase-1/2/3 large subunit